MDSHSFRIIADHYLTLLHGARVEKIHGPRPGVYVFSLFAQGCKARLVLRFERQNPLLFFTAARLANPIRPSAQVMRLRKYCAGKRLGQGLADVNSRCLAFPVGTLPSPLGGEPDDAHFPLFWLVLDMVRGPLLRKELPPEFGTQLSWPDQALVDSLCDIPWQKGAREGPWQEFAVLTPLLRESLAALDHMEGRALMIDLEYGSDTLFLYADAQGRPALYSAWPLPDALLQRRKLRPLLLETYSPPPSSAEEQLDEIVIAPAPEPVDTLLSRFPALAGVRLVDEAVFFRDLGSAMQQEEQKPVAKESKRVARLRAKLNQEEARLHGMLALRDDAKALQAVLWQFTADEKRASVTIEPDQPGGDAHVITLDPLLTVRDNMTRMFRQSARGARGLAMLEKRREDLAREAPAQSTPLPAVPHEQSVSGQALFVHEDEGHTASHSEGGSTGSSLTHPVLLEEKDGESRYPGVARFQSADGFILLRGKNAKGNHSLLKIGSGHDIWFHAETGPSAHVIIRRSHAAEEIPERTLMQAALLAAEKSAQRYDAKASVMIAELRHVHGIKGGSPGAVRVDKVLRTVIVPLTIAEEQQDVLPLR